MSINAYVICLLGGIRITYILRLNKLREEDGYTRDNVIDKLYENRWRTHGSEGDHA